MLETKAKVDIQKTMTLIIQPALNMNTLDSKYLPVLEWPVLIIFH